MRLCYFCQEKEKISHQNPDTLRRFISGQAKILSARRTGLCTKHQRQLAKAIKRARILGLLPFTKK